MARSDPPRWADWFVRKICPEEYLEEVQGDLHEAFHLRVKEKGLKYARRRFTIDALKTIRLFKLKTPDLMKRENLQMFKNYFITGWRFLWKTRVYSTINMFGLAIGIAAASMAYLFLADQMSYDGFHRKASQLYRITGSTVFRGQTHFMGGASYIMGEEFPEKVPGIEKASHFKNDLALRPVEDSYEYQTIHYADRELFDMLDFNFVSGRPGAFERPDQVVISKSLAGRLDNKEELILNFGEEDMVFAINGIFEDMPTTSSLQPEIIVPFSLWVSRVESRRTVNWFDINMNVFLLKNKDVAVEDIEAGMNKVLADNYDVESIDAKLYLQAFSEMHTDETFGLGNGLSPSADFEILRAVLIIGLLCLLISCFNYSNFALGNFLSRSREVAIRKVMGATKTNIFQQFLSESFLSTAIASGIALLLILLVLPGFSLFVGEEYTPQELFTPRFFTGLGLALLVSGFLSGLYPSIVLSSKKAGAGLKEKLKVGGKSVLSWLLVMIQVSMTIFLIIGMLTINRQLDHLVNFDLGYNDNNILDVDIRDTSENRLNQLKRELEQLPFVQEASYNSNYNGTNYEDGELAVETNHLRVDEEFIELMEIPMASGRNFDQKIQTDRRQAIVVNETFVRMAQLQDPVGKQIPFRYGDLENPRIIGVVEDYHFDSPKSSIEPLVMYTSPEYQYQSLLLKLNPQVSNQELGRIEEIWTNIYPRIPLGYTWLDELNAAEMETEMQIQRLSQAGSLIAILLASLGLFGVVGTHVRQRLKEVSIRKVTGATPWSIYWLFSRKFGSWLVLGFLFGALPAIYLLNNWLNDYPERIALGWGIPVMGTLICGLVFLTIITLLLYRVIYLNPARYLRDE